MIQNEPNIQWVTATVEIRTAEGTVVFDGPARIPINPQQTLERRAVPELSASYDPLKLFGEKVRELRKRRLLSQEKFADLCEMDRSYIGGVERGERNVSLLNIVKIASALQVLPTALLDLYQPIDQDRYAVTIQRDG